MLKDVITIGKVAPATTAIAAMSEPHHHPAGRSALCQRESVVVRSQVVARRVPLVRHLSDAAIPVSRPSSTVKATVWDASK